jgi:hypothetical protein
MRFCLLYFALPFLSGARTACLFCYRARAAHVGPMGNSLNAKPYKMPYRPPAVKRKSV